MWCRRRATAAAGRLLLRLLLVVVLLLQAPAAAQSSKRLLRSAEPRDSNLKIVGSIIFPVKVYVKLNQNGPRILCVTNRLRNLELIDPVFQWRGPGGNILSENSSVKISPTGTLMFKRFKSNQSGVYTCSLVYKLTAEQPAKNLIMTYLIYAYSDSNYYYEFTAQYHAAPCNSIYNISFEKALLQARYLIEKFFEQQVEIMRKSSEPLPEIYYIEGTLQMVWVDRCYPGYGMNPLRHPDCPDCCVVCSPGSYNPSNRIHCLPCNNSFMYGATKC